MTWVQQQLDDEAIFPSELGVPFPKDFETRLKNIYKRLFRVYAHMYHSHIERIITLGDPSNLPLPHAFPFASSASSCLSSPKSLSARNPGNAMVAGRTIGDSRHAPFVCMCACVCVCVCPRTCVRCGATSEYVFQAFHVFHPRVRSGGTKGTGTTCGDLQGISSREGRRLPFLLAHLTFWFVVQGLGIDLPPNSAK